MQTALLSNIGYYNLKDYYLLLSHRAIQLHYALKSAGQSSSIYGTPVQFSLQKSLLYNPLRPYRINRRKNTKHHTGGIAGAVYSGYIHF